MKYLENTMLTQLWDKIRRTFQTQTDNGLKTSSKTIVGAINELNGVRNPIIITEDMTEVDEETYQKLSQEGTDVILSLGDGSGSFIGLQGIFNTGDTLILMFGYSDFNESDNGTIVTYAISINTSAPHTLTLAATGACNPVPKSELTPILQEIDLTGTDAERKAKLDQFAADWKALTGASNLNGARFIAKGYFDIPSPPENNVIMTYVENGLVATGYTGIAITTYNSIIGAYRVNIALDGTMSSNVIRDSETTDAFQQFAWAEVPNTYLKIADAASTYETKANVTETLKNYVKGEDAVAIGNIATANAITSIKDDLSPVLQEIDLRGTDAERKAKLDKFETD